MGVGRGALVWPSLGTPVTRAVAPGVHFYQQVLGPPFRAGRPIPMTLQLPCSLYMPSLDGAPMKQTMKEGWLDAIELIQSNGMRYVKTTSRGPE